MFMAGPPPPPPKAPDANLSISKRPLIATLLFPHTIGPFVRRRPRIILFGHIMLPAERAREHLGWCQARPPFKVLAHRHQVWSWAGLAWILPTPFSQLPCRLYGDRPTLESRWSFALFSQVFIIIFLFFSRPAFKLCLR